MSSKGASLLLSGVSTDIPQPFMSRGGGVETVGVVRSHVQRVRCGPWEEGPVPIGTAPGVIEYRQKVPVSTPQVAQT